jgi:hypothetical protein
MCLFTDAFVVPGKKVFKIGFIDCIPSFSI